MARSMVIIGAAMNHWYHTDMNYRGVINMLMMCGCIGQSGGGWAHYVGQEKLRPQTGWTRAGLRAGLDPPAAADELHLASSTPTPTSGATRSWAWRRCCRRWPTRSVCERQPDRLQRARRAHGLAALGAAAADQSAAGGEGRRRRPAWTPRTTWCEALQGRHAAHVLRGPGPSAATGRATCSCGAPTSWAPPARATSTSSSTCWAPATACRARTSAPTKPSRREVVWHDKAPEGKLDLVVTLDFRMSTTCLYSDIVLPTATWYEKNDLNTSDMHPFIHPLSTAVDPAWEARSDWEIYKGFAKKFSELCAGHLGVEKEVVLTPLMHDTPAELAQPFGVADWKRGECELIPGKTAPQHRGGRARLPERVQALHGARPADEQGRQRRQGHRLEHRRSRSSSWASSTAWCEDAGATEGMPKIDTDIDACEVILQLAPGDQRPRGGEGLGGAGQADRPRPHAPGAAPRGREDPLPRRAGAAAQDHLFAHLERHSRAKRSPTTPATPTCTS